jgi:carbonic anhydrase
MPHTDCRMAQSDESNIHELIESKFGVDTRSIEFRVTKDQEAALKSDVSSIRNYPLIREGVSVAAAIYDVKTGEIDFKDF